MRITIFFWCRFGRNTSSRGSGAWHKVGCGPTINFAHNASMPHNLRKMLEREVIQPNGCNVCDDVGLIGLIPVWIAPGDMCAMQENGLLG